jgi:hypothetical protein
MKIAVHEAVKKGCAIERKRPVVGEENPRRMRRACAWSARAIRRKLSDSMRVASQVSGVVRWALILGAGLFCLVTAHAAETPTAIRFEQHRIGKAIVSLPDNWKSRATDVPVWIHLHGAPAVLEAAFAEMGAPGVLVNLTLPGLSKVYADHFADARVFPELMRDIEALLLRLEPERPRRLGRVTISSFSAGFGGVRQLLRDDSSFDRIAAVVMADSLYSGYQGDAAAKEVNVELMSGFLRFAELASAGKKRLVISHSRQVPEGYASTTETADFLIGRLKGERSEVEKGVWPGGLRLLTRYTRGQVEVLGFDGDGPEDHMRHLRSIGVFLRRAESAE